MFICAKHANSITINESRLDATLMTYEPWSNYNERKDVMRNSFMLQPSISRCSFFMCCIIDKDHIEQFVVGSGTRKYGISPLAACLHHTPFIVFFPSLVGWLDLESFTFIWFACPLLAISFLSPCVPLCLSLLPIYLNYCIIVRFSALPASWTPGLWFSSLCTLDVFA